MNASSGGAVPSPALAHLRIARDVLRAEGRALLALADRLDRESLSRAVELLLHCEGSVIVTGMGKAGLVAKKIVATLASTGTPSHFLHPAEAVHGDLGRIGPRDVVLALSFSGQSEEIVRILPFLREVPAALVAVTANPASELARAATVVLDLGSLEEACPHNLAPTTSATAMMALGDALALAVSRMRQFSAEDFARLHPAGSLGRKLARVDDVMRPLSACRVADQKKSVREVFVAAGRPGRRSGAILLIDGAGKLVGLFTDSDLARLLESGRDGQLDRPIAEVMTHRPTTVPSGSLLREAVELISSRKISELPVVDSALRPLGLIDITDVVALLPRDDAAGQGSEAVAKSAQSSKSTAA